MKIAFIYDVVYPFVKGGAEKRNSVFAHLLSQKHDVHLFSMNYWGEYEVLHRDGLTYHGVCPATELYSKNGKRRLFPPIRFGFSLIWKLFKEDFDVIDCSAFPYFPVFVCALYGLIKRKKVYITWHEYWGDYWYEYLGRLGIIGKFVETLALRCSPNIIAVSRKTYRDLIKAGGNPKKMHIVENGVTLGEIHNAPKSSETSDVLFIGRLVKHKNAELLVNSMLFVRSKKPDVKCIIIGSGPEEDRLRELVFSYNLDANVFIKGNGRPQEELYGIMKASKVFVFPSEREGFGITVVEAKAAGLPVITLDDEHNAATYLIRNNVDGLLCKKDPADLAEKILSLLMDNRKRASFGVAAKHSSSIHAWENSLAKLENIFNEEKRGPISSIKTGAKSIVNKFVSFIYWGDKK